MVLVSSIFLWMSDWLPLVASMQPASTIHKGVDNFNIVTERDTLNGGLILSSKSCNFVLVK